MYYLYMKLFFGKIVLASLAVVTLSIPIATVSAQTTSPTNTIIVTAQILPNHYVTIDQYGNILEISSNTDQDVTPRVFVNSVEKANEVPLTDDVFVFYRDLVPTGSSKVGVLYKQSDVFKASSITVEKPKLLQLIR